MTETPETITSPDNEKLKLVRKLADGRGRSKHGLFVTEGEDLLESGIAAGREPEFVLAAAGVHAGGARVLAVDPQLLDGISALGSGTRVIAVWPLPEAEAVDPDLGCVFLDAVADPGNVGTIVRSAAALTGAQVVLGAGCADAYSPKALRAGMGAVLARPPARAAIEATPAPRLALQTRGAASLDAEIARLAPATLVLGAEREGVSEAVLAACDGTATIPLQPGAESLNVAATAAIALHRISSAAAPGPGAPSASAGGS
jgi:TrmH family RNA methyltransferase